MAEYVFPECPHCQHKNTFDLEELRRKEDHRGVLRQLFQLRQALYVQDKEQVE